MQLVDDEPQNRQANIFQKFNLWIPTDARASVKTHLNIKNFSRNN